jgi:dolichol-phosphate mannosyltransferase
MKIKDTTAGFKCYKKEVLANIKPQHIKSRGYGFQIEMKFTAWKLDYKIVEIPIIFTDRKMGSSKMSGGIFSEALWGVLRMKIRSLFIKYKKA